MLDHMVLSVGDLEASQRFYREALAPLGYELVNELEGWAGFGTAGDPTFWIGGRTATKPALHVAFRADARAKVRDFYMAALRAGGIDNGPPGVRKEYHPNYYAAYVLDPDGHNIEAVCHEPE
jgi:catechol 2,3-dioxygenase-like lactoylglutathione lyase family enzyme